MQTRLKLSAALILLVGSGVSTTTAQRATPKQPETSTESRAAGSESGDESPGIGAGEVRIRFTDGGQLVVGLLKSEITIHTRFGNLQIPLSEIRQIQLATRLTTLDIGKIHKNVKLLASDNPDVRNEARRKLFQLGSRAWLLIKDAEKDSNAKIAAEAAKLAEKMLGENSEGSLKPRELDIVQTGSSVISGRIIGTKLSVLTAQFGRQEISLASLNAIENLWDPGRITGEVMPDPGTLHGLQSKVGRTFRFRVKGSAARVVWGSDVYTLDSSLETAAVHAGVLKDGQTGIVAVTILGQKQGFKASARNGVVSHDWGHYPGSYRVLQDGALTLPPIPDAK